MGVGKIDVGLVQDQRAGQLAGQSFQVRRSRRRGCPMPLSAPALRPTSFWRPIDVLNGS